MIEIEDYEKLNVKMGLEIHQQLDTYKLFCRCPSVLRKDPPEYEIKRKLHAIAGESGKIDKAVMHEANLNKEFIYQGYDTTCLIELDEEPPRKINQEAVKIALHIALLMNMKPLPITQIMRKTVIDGSNTSGFQRTVLIAEDGFIETKYGKVGIQYLYLEEDSARIIEKGKKRDIYRLDRLGIPLVEIVTSPDIKTPEQAKEIALKIGEILRSCKVKRGIGTIRQDVNISIKGGNRVEIKGMQDMKIFTQVIKNEIKRQYGLLKKRIPIKMEVRNALPNTETKFMRPLPGSARMYPETDLELLRISKKIINNAKKSLPKLQSEIEKELRKKGLSPEMIKLLLKENKLNEFKELLKEYNNPNLIAKIILIFIKEVATKNNKSLEETENIIKDYYFDILKAIKDKKILESDIKDIMFNIAQGKKFKDAIKIERVDLSEVEEMIVKIIKEKPGLNENAYMGLVMKKFKGKLSGKDAMQIIKKILKQ